MREFLFLLAIPIVCVSTSCSSPNDPHPETRALLKGSWEEEFKVAVPRDISYPEDTVRFDSITFHSVLTFSDTTFKIEITVPKDSSRGKFVLESSYELSGDTLTLLVTRYNNPPRVTKNPYKVQVSSDSLYLDGLPVDIGNGTMAIQSPGYPWWTVSLYRESIGGPSDGSFARARK
jgi:hypothetical protein